MTVADVDPGGVEERDGAVNRDTAALPESVRRQVVELAAAVLGELGEAEVPAALRKVRSFAPARRARAGSGPLAMALERDAVFRHLVAAAWRTTHPDLAEELDDAQVPAAVDPESALVGLYLLRPPGWRELSVQRRADAEQALAARLRREAEGAVHGEVRALRHEVDRLTAALAAEQAAGEALRQELAGARREVRRLRADADRARAAAKESERQAAQVRRDAVDAAQEQQVQVRALQARLRQAQERAEQVRRAAKEGRSLDGVRARLLLDTVVEAATGLRRELALPPVDLRPADLVADVMPQPGSAAGQVSGRGQPAEDPGLLAELLALPQVHLIVDGYNVTKTGYGTLTLAEQRRRLVETLTVLGARTSCEITCCFDGADVDAVAASRVRGVRVLFSAPGVSADELIRRLVRAEPPGRTVVVVSSDQEVISGVVATGARAVPAAALLRLVART